MNFPAGIDAVVLVGIAAAAAVVVVVVGIADDDTAPDGAVTLGVSAVVFAGRFGPPQLPTGGPPHCRGPPALQTLFLTVLRMMIILSRILSYRRRREAPRGLRYPPPRRLSLYPKQTLPQALTLQLLSNLPSPTSWTLPNGMINSMNHRYNLD